MVWINPLIAVSIKTRLPEGYCKCMCSLCHFFVVPLFRDATGVAVALTAWARHRCLQLYLLLLLFFFQVLGVLGPLTYTKTLENWHTCWNLRPLGRRRGWDPGRGTGALRRPREDSQKNSCISHTCLHIFI